MSVTDENLISARISDDVQEAYVRIEENYDISQSNVIRIAPLLFVLLVETFFKQYQEDKFQNAKENMEKKNVGDNLEKSLSFMKRLQKTSPIQIQIQSPEFIEYLRKTVEGLEKYWHDDEKEYEHYPVRSNDINGSQDNVPIYRLFSDGILVRIAEAAAAMVSLSEKKDIPQVGVNGLIPEHINGPLLQYAESALKKNLTDKEEKELRRLFKEKVHSDPETKLSPEIKIASKIAKRKKDDENFARDWGSDNKYIPREYDGQLLYLERLRLGKRLTETQKRDVRFRLRKEVKKLENSAL
ncbi:MAG: hypothetical protein OXC63_09310 [Aestuariivita sp.]|nr:hypothetical protein [Aestuariivita sp.]MCY4347468.1 hypothetical protein [Aestuariivita sp.]